MAVNHERVVADFKTIFLSDGSLALFDTPIDKLFYMTAIETQDVVVMLTGIELEHRHAVGKMVARHEPCCLKLGQHAINGGETNILTGVNKAAIDVFGRQMAVTAGLEDLENLDSRQRHLEPRFA